MRESEAMPRRITAPMAQDQVLSGREVAFLDLREAGPFSQGHPLFAVPCPFSLLEAQIATLVPRRSVPVVLIDDGDGIAEHAGRALIGMGYTILSIVEAGIPAWRGAGLGLYKGVNVVSKTLGELTEHVWHPATIDADTLAGWQAEGRPMAFYDCRPPEEFAKMTVPGARSLSNGELAHRLPTLPDDRPIVLTCAGRTRGIIGARSLAMLATGREIYALENGTQGWVLSGRALLRGEAPGAMPTLGPQETALTRARATAFLAEHDIPRVSADEIARLRDDPARTTFCLDVRSAPEAAADPLAGFDHAPSVQLVQATDQWVGVRHARLVLADDLGLRAGLAAYWLRLLGYAAMVALVDDDLRALSKENAGPTLVYPSRIEVMAALDLVRTGMARFVDLRASSAFAASHIAGSVWSCRPQLAAFSSQGPLVVIGDDKPRADLAASYLAALGHRGVQVVSGGFAALRRAGATVEALSHYNPLDFEDVTSFAHGRHDGDLAASRLYLSWEQGLVGQLDAAERAQFRL